MRPGDILDLMSPVHDINVSVCTLITTLKACDCIVGKMNFNPTHVALIFIFYVVIFRFDRKTITIYSHFHVKMGNYPVFPRYFLGASWYWALFLFLVWQHCTFLDLQVFPFICVKCVKCHSYYVRLILFVCCQNGCCIFYLINCKNIQSPPPSDHNALFSLVSALVTCPRRSQPLWCQCEKSVSVTL